MEIPDAYEVVNDKGEVVFTGTFAECLTKKEELHPVKIYQPGERIECWQVRAKLKSK